MFDFSHIFKVQNKAILDEFIDKYTIYIGIYDDEKTSIITSYYQKILETLSKPFTLEELISNFEDLATYKISLEIPYVILTNEIYGLKSILIHKMSHNSTHSNIIQLLDTFKIINNSVAYIYLHNYIDKLVSLNNVRINSLADLVEKNIIVHYESHLVWLTQLASSIKEEKTTDFVELEDTVCNFGIWLHNDAKYIIQNNSKYKSICKLHENLHLFAKKIYARIAKSEYHILITYLEKCELISLSIGTELALVDNILMNDRITKDTVTGALNRQALKGVFESQYELSLATNSPFILAICDLDFFKEVNDKYGHIAGDKVLESFVNIVKKNIRSSDIIIRYGGEEFIIMLPSIHNKNGIDILENIRQAFEESSINFENQEVKATVSIGMMEITPEYLYKKSFLDDYITMVDRELYVAKEQGRNRLEVCSYHINLK